jgi:hypothetical protein
MKLNNEQCEGIAAWLAIAIIATVVASGAVGVWAGTSYMEANAFNQITGKSVTTWQAMWVTLRVQEGSMPAAERKTTGEE